MPKCKYCAYSGKDWTDLANHIIAMTDEAHDDKKWARVYLSKQTGVKPVSNTKPLSESARLRMITDLLVAKIIPIDHTLAQVLLNKLSSK